MKPQINFYDLNDMRKHAPIAIQSVGHGAIISLDGAYVYISPSYSGRLENEVLTTFSFSSSNDIIPPQRLFDLGIIDQKEKKHLESLKSNNEKKRCLLHLMMIANSNSMNELLCLHHLFDETSRNAPEIDN